MTIVLGQENLIRFKDRLGIPALTKQLTSILGEHIGFKWGPETIAKIDKSISELSQEKQRLGNPITDKKNFLIRFFATLASTTKVELSKNSFKDLVSQNVKSTVSQASYRTGSSEADVKDTVVIFMKAVLQAVEKLSSILESILTKSLDNISTPEAKLSAYPFLKDEVNKYKLHKFFKKFFKQLLGYCDNKKSFKRFTRRLFQKSSFSIS